MKKINFICIIFVSIFLLSASDDQPQREYYYAFNEKIFLDVVANKFVLSYDEKNLSDIQTNLQRNTQISNMEFQKENNHCILTTADKSNVRTLTEGLKRQVGVKSINPMYLLYGGTEMGITDEIVVQFKENVSQQEIDNIFQKYRLVVKNFHPNSQLLSVPIDLDPLEIANAIQRSGLVNYSHPDFLLKMEKFQSLPSDPYFTNQYYLRNTGQIVNGRTCTAGADINVLNAWNITKGSSDIVIAVLDEGVTNNHSDLPNTRQVRLSGSNFTVAPSGNDPSPVGNNNHGNSCAGIIAASHNSEGIAGIAPNCQIMPVRLPFNVSYDPSSRYAAAIRFAADNDADVISNSWGITIRDNWGNVIVPNHNQIPEIVGAIQYATTTGRNNKGCVVVFAVGNTANHNTNNNGYISFPANVNIPGVLTVGASDRNDMQANYSPTSVLNSPNNQIIDVVAPSHRAYSSQIATETFDVWTIDIPGNAGYNQVHNTDGGTLPVIGTILPNAGINHLDYTGHFGGTSAACPQVAGVAALMLSVNPNLTQARVATIIRSTARKARTGTTYNYQTTAGRPDGTWNAQMGYGVLNAHAAVNAAIPPPTISGPSLVCSNTTFTVSNAPAEFYWATSSNISNYGSNSSSTVSLSQYPGYYTPGGAGWISIKNSSGTEVARKDVWVGVPAPTIRGSEYVYSPGWGYGFPYETYYADYSSLSGITSFYWNMVSAPPNNNSSYYSNLGSSNSAYVTFPADGVYQLSLAAYNACGYSMGYPATLDISVYGIGYRSFSSYPNPASNILNIEIDEDAIAQAKALEPTTTGAKQLKIDPTYDIRLYDGQGNLLRNAKTKGGTVQFNVANLTNGIYYLHIYDGTGDKPEMRQIVVEH